MVTTLDLMPATLYDFVSDSVTTQNTGREKDMARRRDSCLFVNCSHVKRTYLKSAVIGEARACAEAKHLVATALEVARFHMDTIYGPADIDTLRGDSDFMDVETTLQCGRVVSAAVWPHHNH